MDVGPEIGYQVAAEAGFSIRDVDRVRVGRDILTWTVRATRTSSRSMDLWADAGRFVRPDLVCSPSLPCNEEGWLARVGVAAISAPGRGDTGLAAGFRAGLGATASEDTELAYLIGLSIQTWLHPAVAPYAELRWERLTGINMTLLAVGAVFRP